MRHAIYPGSFDPFTLGHLDIVERGLARFDRITILLAINPDKSFLLPIDERLAVIRACVSHLPGANVDSHPGLVVDYARTHGAGALLRGLRAAGDFEFEAQLARINRRLAPELDTVFLLAAEEHVFVNSSIVRELFRHGNEVRSFVPGPVAEALEILRTRRENQP